jgi:hypothetical protein
MECEAIIKILGYTDDWLRLGVVDSSYLASQYLEYQNSDDQNPEHYRARAFERFIHTLDHLTKDQIEALFHLIDNGTDGWNLCEGRILEILLSGLLTDEQLIWLSKFPEVHNPPIQKRYHRILIECKLKNDGLTDNIFEEICKSGDSNLHITLLHRKDIQLCHLQWLAEKGGNKAVRNQAKQFLCKMKSRQRT